LEFDKYDKQSFSFRYPVDKKNSKVFKYDIELNIVNLVMTMQKVNVLFCLLSNILSDIEEEMLAEKEFVDSLCQNLLSDKFELDEY
jgi:hypothetical protein